MKPLLRRRDALRLAGGLAVLPGLSLARAQRAAGDASGTRSAELSDDPAHLRPAVPLRVLFELLAPFSYLDDAGRPVGFLIELIAEMGRRADFECRFELSSWARSEAQALSEPNVLLAAVARLPEREGQYNWIGPTVTRFAHLYRLSTRPQLRLAKLADARRYLIGVLKDDVAERELRAKGFVLNRQLDRSPDVESMMRKLFAGRDDLLALSAATVPDILRRTGHRADQIESALGYAATPLYLGLSRTSDAATERKLTQAFAAMHHDGWLARLRERYPEIPQA